MADKVTVQLGHDNYKLVTFDPDIALVLGNVDFVLSESPFQQYLRAEIIIDPSLSEIRNEDRLKFTCHHAITESPLLIFAISNDDVDDDSLHRALDKISIMYKNVEGQDHMERYAKVVYSFPTAITDNYQVFDNAVVEQADIAVKIFEGSIHLPTELDRDEYIKRNMNSQQSQGASSEAQTPVISRSPVSHSITDKDSNDENDNFRTALHSNQDIIENMEAPTDRLAETNDEIASQVEKERQRKEQIESRPKSFEDTIVDIVCHDDNTVSTLVSKFLPLNTDEEVAHMFDRRRDLCGMLRHHVIHKVSLNYPHWMNEVLETVLSAHYRKEHYFPLKVPDAEISICPTGRDMISKRKVDPSFRKWYMEVASIAVSREKNFSTYTFLQDTRKKFGLEIPKDGNKTAAASILTLGEFDIPH